MATFRETPYAAFNFTVAMDGLDPGSVQAGFASVSGLDRAVELLRYRAGNDRTLSPRLIPGLAQPVTVTLSRGLIGDLSLHQWLQTALNGEAERRTVIIQLMSEDRTTVAQAWRLRNALPTRIDGPTLDAMANEVAIETLVLNAERLEVE